MTRIPTSSEIEDYLDPAYYEEQVQGSSSKHHEDQLRNYKKLIEPYAGKLVLDVGAGSGKTVAIMSEKAHYAIALDFSPISVRTAKKMIHTSGKEENAGVVQSRGEVLPFPDNTFDMVTALDFVEHINNEEYEKLIVEIKRVLKPNGTLCIYTPNKTYFLEYIYKIVFGPGHRPQHFGLKTIPELLAPLGQHGYEVAHLSTQANYVPVLRQVEQVLMHLPVVGQLFKRRVSIRATKRA